MEVVGFSGCTINRLIVELDSIKNKNFDVVVLIGTNNIFTRRIDDNLEPVEDDFTDSVSLISKFLKSMEFLSKNFKQNKCFILPILPRGAFSGTNRRLTLVNGRIKATINQFSDCNVKFGEVSYADFIGSDFAAKKSLYQKDRPHLNRSGRQFFQDLIKKFINQQYPENHTNLTEDFTGLKAIFSSTMVDPPSPIQPPAKKPANKETPEEAENAEKELPVEFTTEDLAKSATKEPVKQANDGQELKGRQAINMIDESIIGETWAAKGSQDVTGLTQPSQALLDESFVEPDDEVTVRFRFQPSFTKKI